jgi:nitrogen fixation/metabolism regulation signal transduction histidine kinase
MAETIDSLKKENEMLIKQTDRIDKFDLDKEIGLNPKDDKVYDRTMEIVIKMPKMISELNGLKTELKLTGKQEVDEAPFIETVAETRR